MKNKKGFTLVELLAVIVILGIIMTVSIPAVSKWINRSKNESLESQKQTLLMAGEAYAQGNSKVLPKVIGETKIIKAEELKKANYLKEDIKDADKRDCMKNSFVRIYKYDKKGYTYTAYLYCEGDTVPDVITGVEPIIGITFSGDNVTDGNIQDVSTSSFKATIEGGKKDGKNLGIDGYSYSISVKYNGTGELVEIFNSGSLNAGGREKIVIEKNLGDYTNITTVSEFIITVEAYNRDGGYKRVIGNSKYGDKTPPICGTITGQAGVNQWFNSPHTSTISVKCSDGKGSGCLKEVFTQSWNTEVEDDFITIKDNAGNTTDCKVRVHHDWTRPTLTVTAYKRNEDGSKGAQVGTVTANNTNNNVVLDNYTNSYGNNRWLNRANYKDGVYFEITVSDNIHINTGQWYYNNTGITDFNASNINTMNTGSSKTFTKADNKTSVTLTGEGLRRARYEVIDFAGNKVVVNIEANIDHTNPSCTSSGGSSSWTNGNRTLTGTCSDSISKCKGNITKTYNSDIKSTKETPGTVYDNANNSTTCPANQTVYIDKTPPSCYTSKADTANPNGVTVNIGCSDNLSGLASCPCRYNQDTQRCQAETGLKNSKYYYVSDNAGNSNSCYVNVIEYTAYRSRTRSCDSWKYCQNSACGTCGGGTANYQSYSSCKSGCNGRCEPWDDMPGTGITGGWVCYKYTYNCSCRTPGCGCETFSAWSAWSGYSETVCNENDYTSCGSRIQYK